MEPVSTDVNNVRNNRPDLDRTGRVMSRLVYSARYKRHHVARDGWKKRFHQFALTAEHDVAVTGLEPCSAERAEQ